MKAGLVADALNRMPRDIRDAAGRVVLMTAEGYGTYEIGSVMGCSWHRVEALRAAVGSHLTVAMRESGCGDAEIIRTLGVASAVVMQNGAADIPPGRGRL